METNAEIQNINIDDFQEKAYDYAKQYDKTRTAREIFTYNVTSSLEKYYAKKAIDTAEEFIVTIREIMLDKL